MQTVSNHGWQSGAVTYVRSLAAYLGAVVVAWGGTRLAAAAGVGLSFPPLRSPAGQFAVAASGMLGGLAAGVVLGLVWPARRGIGAAGMVGAGLTWLGIGEGHWVRNMFLPVLAKDPWFIASGLICILGVALGYRVGKRWGGAVSTDITGRP